MESTQKLTNDYSAIGESILLIWWGLVILLDPLTLGMGAIGTGLILLGLNAVRLMNAMPTKSATTTAGVIALMWGSLDTIFNLSVGASFAMLLVVMGMVVLANQLLRIGRDSSPAV